MLIDIDNKILILIGEKILYYVVSGNVVGSNDIDKEYNSVDIGVEMELS